MGGNYFLRSDLRGRSQAGSHRRIETLTGGVSVWKEVGEKSQPEPRESPLRERSGVLVFVTPNFTQPLVLALADWLEEPSMGLHVHAWTPSLLCRHSSAIDN